MKILKIIHGYPPIYNAGSEVYSQSICNKLAKRHYITVFTREADFYAADHIIRKEKKGDIEFYIVNKAREKDGYEHNDLDKQFFEIIRKISPDIAHIGHLNHLSTGLTKQLKAANVPTVFTLHDFWLMCPRGQFLQINFANPDFHQICTGQENRKCSVNCYNRFFSGEESNYARDVNYWTDWIASRMKATRNIIQDVDFFIAPSMYLLNRFVNDFELPKDKVTYLDYGFPTHYLKPVQRNSEKNFTIGYIGTHIPSKGIDVLIKAFAKVNKKANLKIWGRRNGHNTDNLKALAKSCSNKVEFLGEYMNENISLKVFANVDCIVVPSIWGENSPLVIHEAQACRIPVITANFGGMCEYVKHLENGLLFEHRNADDLAVQLTFAITHLDLMRKLGERGYLYNENSEVPDIKDHCESLEVIYKEVINGKA